MADTRSPVFSPMGPTVKSPPFPRSPVTDVKPKGFGEVAQFPVEVELVSHFQTHSDGTVSTYYPPLASDIGVGIVPPPSDTAASDGEISSEPSTPTEEPEWHAYHRWPPTC